MIKISQFLKFLGKYTVKWLLLSTLGSIIIACIEFTLSSLLGLFLKSIGLLPEGFPLIGPLSSLSPTVLVISVVLVLIGIIRSAAQYCVLQGAMCSQEGIRMRLSRLISYDLLLRSSPSLSNVSEYQHLMFTMTPYAAQFCQFVSQMISFSLQAFLLFCALMYLAPKETFASIGGLGILGLVGIFVSRKVRFYLKSMPDQQKGLTYGIQRIVKNSLLVRVLKMQAMEFQRMTHHIHKASHLMLTSASWNHLYTVAIPFTGILLIIFILSMSLQIFETPGNLLLPFLYMFIRFVQALSNFVQFVGHASLYSVHFRDAAKYFFTFSDQDIEAALHQKYDPIVLAPLLSEETPPFIKAENLMYSFGEEPLFENISFHVEQGSHMGIMGPSGSGKTTLLYLLLGVGSPTSGTLTINQQDPKTYVKKEGVRIGYVGVEPYLVQGTLEENLKYGPYIIPPKDLEAALDKAYLGDVITKLSKGLQHELDEMGEGLSAGQKQRLCLARALAINPQILILDEFTANLDEEAETLIVERLNQLKGQCTIISVSHKASTLKYCDHILRLGT